MKEIEVKIYSIDETRLRSALQRLGAKKAKDVFLRTFHYTSPEIERKGLTMRIRYDGTRAVLTVKGKKHFVGKHKIREEYETEVDGPAMEAALHALGYKVSTEVEMKRTYWQLYGCSVELCQLPRVPSFMEIEGNPKSILKVARALGYSEADYETASPGKKFGMPKNLRRWTF